MEAKAINSNYQLILHRIGSLSCSSSNRNNSIRFSTYKCNGYSKIYSNPFAWSNDIYTRKNYKGIMLVRQSNDIQSSAVTPGPLPPGKPWSNWLAGVILSLVFPFVTNKWGRLLAIKNEICAVVSTVETVAETVEKFAKEVAHVADEVANNLPEGGTLQNIACNIANAAEETAKDAHFVDQFIDKVGDVENEIVSSIASGLHKTAPHEEEGNLNEVTKDNDDIQSDKQLEQKNETAAEVPQNEIIDQPK